MSCPRPHASALRLRYSGAYIPCIKEAYSVVAFGCTVLRITNFLQSFVLMQFREPDIVQILRLNLKASSML
jgi:hypothetical protein